MKLMVQPSTPRMILGHAYLASARYSLCGRGDITDLSNTQVTSREELTPITRICAICAQIHEERNR
jgi:hypothetical protein